MLGAGRYRRRIRKPIPAGNGVLAWLGGMLLPETRPAARRRTRPVALLAMVVLVVTLLAVLDHPFASSAAPTTHSTPAAQTRPSVTPSAETVGAPPRARPTGDDGGRAVGSADGVLPAGVSVFDSHHPGVVRLDPSLLGALRRAARDATDDGVELDVTTGWRSRAYQSQLFREAVTQYGSTAEAARWVAAPGTSAHESGRAVDVGPSDAVAWLAGHGAPYGLCQVYDNEPWHYELRVTAVAEGCPRPYADPTEDPRLHR